MKLIRKFTLILAVLLISTVFVGAGAAFTYSVNDAVVTPSTELAPGQTVTATMKITVTGGSLGVSDKISLTTPLTGVKWSTDIYRGGVSIINDYELSTISGFMLESDADLVLHITLSGKVASASEGKEISVMTISATSKEANGYTTFSTKKQKVPGAKEDLPESLTLKNGWNFISVPKALATGTASSLFAGVDTKDNAILAYDASAQDWKQVTADTLIKPLNGYWIYSNGTAAVSLSYVTEPTVPAVKQLYPGWNAVGVSAGESVPASSFLAGTPWRVALTWDSADGNWMIPIIKGGSSVNSAEQYMTPGNGIWLYAETEGTLIGLTA